MLPLTAYEPVEQLMAWFDELDSVAEERQMIGRKSVVVRMRPDWQRQCSTRTLAVNHAARVACG